MLDLLNNLDVDLKVVIISASTSISIFFVGWIIKFWYEKYSLNYKLRREFVFEQKRKFKEEISINKVGLLNIAEQLNYRLWGFNYSVKEYWHNIDKENWFKGTQYYLNSFLYRLLLFIHLIVKTEKDTLTIDTTIAEKEDILYLKYIKTLKNIFSDARFLKELGYDGNDNTHHFFKDDLETYSELVTKNGRILSFSEFKNSLRNNFDEFQIVIDYISKIKDSDEDVVLNTLRCLHILIIHFLNKFGHDYQKTEKKKLDELLKFYSHKIKVKQGFGEYLERSKLKSEFRRSLKILNAA